MLFDPAILVERFCQSEQEKFNRTGHIEQTVFVLAEKLDGSVVILKDAEACRYYVEMGMSPPMYLFAAQMLGKEDFNAEIGEWIKVKGVILSSMHFGMLFSAEGENGHPHDRIAMPALMFSFVSEEDNGISASFIDTTTSKTTTPVRLQRILWPGQKLDAFHLNDARSNDNFLIPAEASQFAH